MSDPLDWQWLESGAESQRSLDMTGGAQDKACHSDEAESCKVLSGNGVCADFTQATVEPELLHHDSQVSAEI